METVVETVNTASVDIRDRLFCPWTLGTGYFFHEGRNRMDYSESILYLFEIVGTIAFASSGALVGIRKNMDILGVNILGITTAVGGGIIRDVILGIHPPKMFANPVYALCAIIISCILFTIVYFHKEFLSGRFMNQYERAMNLFDAIGLGIFTATGINTAIEVNLGDNWFLLIFVGVLTGVGGGILRDIMAKNMPVILAKQVYASASILGAVVYILLLKTSLGHFHVMCICALVVVAVRLLAAKYRWDLPRIR